MPDLAVVRRRLSQARLYVLIDGRDSDAALAGLSQQLVQAGVDVLQLRDKSLSDRDLLRRARVLRRATRGTRTLLVVNDRPDLALLANADGVHVGQDELTLDDVRHLAGGRLLVGVSAHTLGQVREAMAGRADYVGCGPIFASQTKQFQQFAGLDLLRQAHRELRIPAFAIGGITAENLPQVLQTGFRRIAVSQAVAAADDPAAAVQHLREMLAMTA